MIYSTTAELDYVGVPFNVTFVESSTQSVAISVLDDDLVERPEIEITDDDGKIFFQLYKHCIQITYNVNFLYYRCCISVLHDVL